MITHPLIRMPLDSLDSNISLFGTNGGKISFNLLIKTECPKFSGLLEICRNDEAVLPIFKNGEDCLSSFMQTTLVGRIIDEHFQKLKSKLIFMIFLQNCKKKLYVRCMNIKHETVYRIF